MAHLSREEALRLGHKVLPIKHSMKRRALWHDYSRLGIYMLTIHIATDNDGRCYEGMLLSHIEGRALAPADSADFPHCVLTPLGEIVNHKINAIPSYERFSSVEVKDYVIMPTHIHLILQVHRDLPYDIKRHRQNTLGDLVRGFKQGCTSLFKRWLQGEPLSQLFSPVNGERNYTTTPGGKSSITLWEDGYNDHPLLDDDAQQHATHYVNNNAYFWKLQIEYPHLFEHRLHVTVAGTDYSTYGCLFLLRRPERHQIMCHRLARRGMLTTEEWQKATASWDAIRAFEHDARRKKLGHYDHDWYRRSDADAITPIDYTRTEAFRKEKEQCLDMASYGVVMASPAVSKGEQEIFYAVLEAGYACIKFQKAPIPAKGHPVDRDRHYCGKGQLLVVGPWEIQSLASTPEKVRTFQGAQRGRLREMKDSAYAQSHNLNAMVADFCTRNVAKERMALDRKTLAET